MSHWGRGRPQVPSEQWLYPLEIAALWTNCGHVEQIKEEEVTAVETVVS